jgi:hypothetical protein
MFREIYDFFKKNLVTFGSPLVHSIREAETCLNNNNEFAVNNAELNVIWN